MQSKLAINGGAPIRSKPFPAQITTGKEEKEAVLRVLDKGKLSGYRGNWVPEFFGGEEIQALEKEWCAYFRVKHAIPCNSATSGLQIACGAVGLAPGDEVIVTPYSMTCSATAPLLWNAIPIFADVEPDYFCLDPKSVEDKITKRTRAILVVDLFGQPYNVERINKIANKHNLYIIEDAAQAIGSVYTNIDEFTIHSSLNKEKKFAGVLGSVGYDKNDNSGNACYSRDMQNWIGVYSFNFGKHITCGEGGMIVTNNDDLAMRCRLIMNHAEAVINSRNNVSKNILFPSIIQNQKNNMLGFNMRMTEINAAIIREQLKKLDMLVAWRQKNANYLAQELNDITPIISIPTRPFCTHSYYVQPFLWLQDYANGISRDKFINAVKAELAPLQNRKSEGVPLGCGYIQPLYRMPLFQEGRLYGGKRFPWKRKPNYAQLLPNVEKLWQYELFLHRFLGYPTTIDDLKDVIKAFWKVWENRKELK